jgi:hypothetical protein
LIYAENVDILGKNVIIIKRYTASHSDASKEDCLEANTGKAKYMLVSCDHATGQTSYIKVANKYFTRIADFKYLETTATKQNCIHEEINGTLNWGCLLPCSSEFLSSRMLIKDRYYSSIHLERLRITTKTSG